MKNLSNDQLSQTWKIFQTVSENENLTRGRQTLIEQGNLKNKIFIIGAGNQSKNIGGVDRSWNTFFFTNPQMGEVLETSVVSFNKRMYSDNEGKNKINSTKSKYVSNMTALIAAFDQFLEVEIEVIKAFTKNFDDDKESMPYKETEQVVFTILEKRGNTKIQKQLLGMSLIERNTLINNANPDANIIIDTTITETK